MNTERSRAAGRLAIATGVVGLVNIVTIILLYTVGGYSGTLNDLGVALQAILNAALAWKLYSLIGFWLVVTNRIAQSASAWPRRLTQFGLVIGVIMLIGLLTGPAIFTLDAAQEAAPWRVYLGYAGGFGWFVLLPVWSPWLGRTLLSEPLASPGVPTTSSAT
jgi:hypothetical protein